MGALLHFFSVVLAYEALLMVGVARFWPNALSLHEFALDHLLAFLADYRLVLHLVVELAVY